MDGTIRLGWNFFLSYYEVESQCHR
jgi:hypothetical protein